MALSIQICCLPYTVDYIYFVCPGLLVCAGRPHMVFPSFYFLPLLGMSQNKLTKDLPWPTSLPPLVVLPLLTKKITIQYRQPENTNTKETAEDWLVHTLCGRVRRVTKKVVRGSLPVTSMERCRMRDIGRVGIQKGTHI